MARPKAIAVIALGLALLSAAGECAGYFILPADDIQAPGTPTKPPDLVLTPPSGRVIHDAVFSADGRRAFIIVDAEVINVWEAIVHCWPEALSVVIVVWSSWFLRRTWLRFRGRGELGVPYCNKCRYQLTGCPSERCPECGADVTENSRVIGLGAARGAMVVRLSVMLAMLAAVILLETLEVPRHGKASRWFRWDSLALAEWSEKQWDKPWGLRRPWIWLARMERPVWRILEVNLATGAIERSLLTEALFPDLDPMDGWLIMSSIGPPRCARFWLSTNGSFAEARCGNRRAVLDLAVGEIRSGAEVKLAVEYEHGRGGDLIVWEATGPPGHLVPFTRKQLAVLPVRHGGWFVPDGQERTNSDTSLAVDSWTVGGDVVAHGVRFGAASDGEVYYYKYATVRPVEGRVYVTAADAVLVGDIRTGAWVSTLRTLPATCPLRTFYDQKPKVSADGKTLMLIDHSGAALVVHRIDE